MTTMTATADGTADKPSSMDTRRVTTMASVKGGTKGASAIRMIIKRPIGDTRPGVINGGWDRLRCTSAPIKKATATASGPAMLNLLVTGAIVLTDGSTMAGALAMATMTTGATLPSIPDTKTVSRRPARISNTARITTPNRVADLEIVITGTGASSAAGIFTSPNTQPVIVPDTMR